MVNQAFSVPYSHSRSFRANKNCVAATLSHSVHTSLRPPVGLLYLHIIAFHLDKRQRVYYFMLEEKAQKSVLDWAFGFLCIMSMLATVTFLKPLTTCYYVDKQKMYCCAIHIIEFEMYI